MVEFVYGIHIIQSLLDFSPKCFLKVYVLDNYHNNYRLKILIERLEKICIIKKVKNRHFLYKQVGVLTHQGIIAEIHKKNYFQESYLLELLIKEKNPLILVLDCITDPHNLGACLRCAHAFGVHVVIIPRNRSSQMNATVRKVASGAAEIVPLIRVTNLVRTLQLLQKYGIRVVGTILQSNHYLGQSQLLGKLALVMGSEGTGIRYLTRKTCDELISIPMISSCASLNVAVATGICLFEVLRQKMVCNY
ncbi:23S rRNA (guanosine(2251)-2'-O)-methyltransferase RlmB [Blochmannia endosymbiont of Camponotus (Colobopsis) obliquus]|uniref:23S rRNA (guanosine(2251)-2'-O)-methyltransferase RlmB n=1 Tax=Blochmannia endosymbiont of Camponotus (Colobopsis) obliquus TaxID=1505597 RepID=UPI00061A82F8|nr:23S rRNA (guanosine(2251)-2'-O)-methyltransferase RlmB [Blochmannia endosymbiont of Camponotus (Colobopsis) obliquus]AKC60263.1 23S rRNA (guanosine-2'-O-)-methyltransferase RlmB [Blochmannia endosymbiont of Camponotus (Colobopsis) obliquus]